MDITLQGTLQSFHLPEILTFLNMGEKTGILNLSSDHKTASLYIDKGNVIYAVSNQERFRLSTVLLRKNRIDEDRWRKLEQLMLTEHEKFGRLAVKQNILTEEELNDFLKIQASEIIYDCFACDAGTFDFSEAMQLPSYAMPIAIDHLNLIMEGARRIDRIEYLSQHLPPGNAVLRTVGDPAAQEALHLTLEEWKLLFLIDGKRTLEEICSESLRDRREVYCFVYGLLANHFLEVLPVTQTDAEEQHEGKEDPAITLPVKGKLPGDIGLLISTNAQLTYKDVLKITLARLTLKRPDAEKETFPLIEQEYFIGRQMGNQIHLSDPSISNVHARIFKGPEGYVLEDMNSRNGTFVNGVRIDRKLLHENDAVRLGNSHFIYNIVYEVKRLGKTSAS